VERGSWYHLAVPYDLTVRELEVLRLLASDATDHAAANALFVSVLTVKAHTAHIAAKMGVATRDEVVARAKEEGL
jgi:ATP/maltotriose-dependent transcriptional regulator MalT